jgi:DNA polymerase elongation subunit (family B)
MVHSTGWILDVSIEQNRAIIWIKTTEGNILRLTDTYRPNFYILPKDEDAGATLFQILSQESVAKKVEWEYKFTDLFDPESRELKRLICVQAESILSYKSILNRLDKDARVAQLFNTDLSHIQQYLFMKLRIEPSSKVEIEYDKDDSRLLKINKINEDEVAPPPFSILYFDMHTSFSLNSDANLGDPIFQISARYQEESDVSFEDDEDSIFNEFHEYVLTKDPDILISTNQRFEGTNSDDYLFQKMGSLGLDLGREPSIQNHGNKINRIQGRVDFCNRSFHSDLGLAGLIERARFGFLPLGVVARCRINRLIESRNFHTLMQKGFVIPGRDHGRHEKIRTLEEINAKDRGGIIFSPRVGLHENVVVLDYENEYANLIVRKNLGYETSNDQGRKEHGLLPTVLESVLNRRIFFKNLQKSFPVNTNEWFWCEQRIEALKGILVSLYGTTGSFWNRFANVEVFEEINRLSREVLIKTKDIAQALGFELLYADTDSVFLKKSSASLKNFEHVRNALTRETGLPISLKHYYKFLVLLPLEASEKMEALKHYFGITHTGELLTRGIEIRRHDAPNFIKQFQTELLYTLFDCENPGEVISKGYESALLLVTKTIDKVMTGNIQLQDLVVSKLLGQGLDKYRSLFPHVSAAIQLAKNGKSTMTGDGVEYIFTNSRHTNTLCRVTPRHFIDEGKDFDYDKEKYREMLLEATETVLGYIGFNRTVYGYDPNRTVYGYAPKKNKKWWHEIVDRRIQDTDNEKY